MIRARTWRAPSLLALVLVVLLGLATTAQASVGDRMPAFKECVQVRGTHNLCATGSLGRLTMCLRSASKKTAVLRVLQPLSVSPSSPPHCLECKKLTDVFCSHSPTPPPLDLLVRMRLHLPTHHHRPPPRGRHARSPVPRQVALHPPSRHPGAPQRALLGAQPMGTLVRPAQAPPSTLR